MDAETYAARVAALEEQIARLTTQVTELTTWRSQVEERRRQAKERAAAAAAAAVVAQAPESVAEAASRATRPDDSVSVATNGVELRRVSSGPGRPPRTWWVVYWSMLWRRAQGFLLRAMVNFLIFLYMSKLHRWIRSIVYKYYMLLLLKAV